MISTSLFLSSMFRVFRRLFSPHWHLYIGRNEFSYVRLLCSFDFCEGCGQRDEFELSLIIYI